MMGLADQVSKLTATVERNNEKLERIAVFEVSLSSTNAAIERAFGAIGKTREELESSRNEISERVDVLETQTMQKHSTYDKYMWTCVGFATAVSLVWSAFGYRLNTMLDNVGDRMARFDLHVAQDKILTSDDVRQVTHGR